MNKEQHAFLERTKETRLTEIAEGKNDCTRNPIYIVYQLTTSVAPHDWDRDVSTSECFTDKFGRFDEDGSLIDYSEFADEDFDNDYPIEHPEYGELTQTFRVGYHDVFVAAFFTRQAAQKFIEDDDNLKSPFIYVEYIHHKNTEMLAIMDIVEGK
jgi:hypothetical protein